MEEVAKKELISLTDENISRTDLLPTEPTVTQKKSNATPVSSTSVPHWTNNKLMQKLKNKSFSSKIQKLMDTKYKYYNPFENLNSKNTFGGFKSHAGIQKNMCTKEVGTYNSLYSDLFKYWKPSFVS